MSTEDLYQDEVEHLDDLDDAADTPEDRSSASSYAHDDQYTQPNAEAWPDADPADEAQPVFANDYSPEQTTFESLALELTLRCGQLKLTLGELRRLDAGTVLEVAGIAPGHATLCHGERVVAEGELVDVDGRLGLQITRMVTQP